jgi:alkylated DNA repair dioxygenase AlkB
MQENTGSRQARLFDDSDLQPFEEQLEADGAIPGLRYLDRFLSAIEHDYLLTVIDAQPWLIDLKRRVQHYGYKYDYKKRAVDVSMRLGDLPPWADTFAKQLLRQGYFAEMPDQVIVNDYQPGQGIAGHVDCPPCFTDTVAAITLGSSCVMDFTHRSRRKTVRVMLRPCSLIVMRGEARYDWLHGIAARQSDTFRGLRFRRGRRVSVTFRKVIVEA